MDARERGLGVKDRGVLCYKRMKPMRNVTSATPRSYKEPELAYRNACVMDTSERELVVKNRGVLCYKRMKPMRRERNV